MNIHFKLFAGNRVGVKRILILQSLPIKKLRLKNFVYLHLNSMKNFYLILDKNIVYVCVVIYARYPLKIM